MFNDFHEPSIFEYGCQKTRSISDDYLAVLCVVTDNNPFLGLLYNTSPAFINEGVQFDVLMARTRNYEYVESETRILPENDAIKGGYRFNVSVKTDRGSLTLPQRIGTDACSRHAPVVFLNAVDTWCSAEFSDAMCSTDSMWSSLDYLVPKTASSCLTSPQVLNDPVNSTAVPTDVAYYCIENASAYTTVYDQDWGLIHQNRSFFDTSERPLEEFDPMLRCKFDDGVSTAPVPQFTATPRMCINVVLKVHYDIYWKGTSIVQVRAKITLGNMHSPTGNLIVSQRFSVKFIYLNEVNPAKLPFIEPAIDERSGNPGYIRGRKVIAKIIRVGKTLNNVSV